MDDFRYDVFDEELMEIFGDKYEILKTKISSVDSTLGVIDKNIAPCDHSSTFDGDSVSICKECGTQLDYLDFQPEWRYYGTADNRINKDPSRCHKNKENLKGGIDKVFQDAKLTHLPLAIRKSTENKYRTIVGDETVRGKGRKAIVAACLMYSYREEGDVRTSDEIRLLFDLGKQDMSTGIFRYHSSFKEDRIKPIRPTDLLRRIMNIVKIDMSHYKNIMNIARRLEKRDILLNRSSPQAVASAIIYLYISMNIELKKSIGFNKIKFASDVKLSELTITKLVKRAAAILDADIQL
jgi:transcription initiation factor TFIIIB Brf1 subunit/transcription initiation factor TFIIB